MKDKMKWHWIHFIPVIGFYAIPKQTRDDITDFKYRNVDALVLMLICLESLFVIFTLLMLAS